MLNQRLELHEKLCTLLGSNSVYFNPPETIKLKYPCFVYDFDSLDQRYANNHHYLDRDEYSITYITKDVESDIFDRFIEVFPTAKLDNRYKADNLAHYVFTLHF